MNPSGSVLGALALAALAALAACSTPAAEADPGAEMRVLVKLAQPSADAAAIARAVEQVAGTPTRYLASSSPHWHALALHCGAPADCDAALQRLRADRAFAAVQRDERRRIVTP